MVSKGKSYALARYEILEALADLLTLISYEGTTTADGAGDGDGSTLIDSVLTTKPDFNGNLVIITSGDYAGQARDINGITTGGTVTPASAFGGRIVSGVTFVIVGIRTTPAEVAAIEVKLDNLGAFTAIDNLKAILGAYTAAATLKAAIDRTLFCMDFWSDPQEEVQVAQAAGTLVITPTVTVEDLPDGAVIVRAIAMFKFRMIENIHAGVNSLDGATDPDTSQVIQVKETAAGAYIDAINFVASQFTLADTAREGGDVLIGSINIAAQVDANDSYTFQWLLRKALQNFINFNDVQVGLRIWYSV